MAREPRVHHELVFIDQSQLCQRERELHAAHEQSRTRLPLELLHGLLQIPGAEIVRGAGGIDEGLPEGFKDATLPKFRPDGLLVVHAGGTPEERVDFVLAATEVVAGVTTRVVEEREWADGELLTCEPADVLPMAQRYFLF